uniref:Uncharacterized protein n=1 Tax=Aegilops tauschii TaxID=37682 RepID=M8D393_AEGTA
MSSSPSLVFLLPLLLPLICPLPIPLARQRRLLPCLRTPPSSWRKRGQHAVELRLATSLLLLNHKWSELFLNLVMEYVPETLYRGLKNYSNTKQGMSLIYVKLYTYQGCEATIFFGGQGLWMGIIFGILVQVLLFVAITLHTIWQNKPFEHKSFYGRTFMGFGVLNGISIWLLNQSLCFNSVGFYQGKSSALVGSRFLILHRTCQKVLLNYRWKTCHGGT